MNIAAHTRNWKTKGQKKMYDKGIPHHRNEWPHIVRPDIIGLEGVNQCATQRDVLCVCVVPSIEQACERESHSHWNHLEIVYLTLCRSLHLLYLVSFFLSFYYCFVCWMCAHSHWFHFDADTKEILSAHSLCKQLAHN